MQDTHHTGRVKAMFARLVMIALAVLVVRAVEITAANENQFEHPQMQPWVTATADQFEHPQYQKHDEGA
jgi:hypothetical protein